MNQNVKNLIEWWSMKGKQEQDPFLKFFMFYMCFDAWITSESGQDSDQGKLEWFFENDNCLKTQRMGFWESPDTKGILTGLKNLCPIHDMRPNRRGEPRTIKDINNIEEVVRAVYQIRCNLFHGAKNPNDTRDDQLVSLAARLMEKWITWAVLKCF